MKQYAFILGRNPALSVGELASVFPGQPVVLAMPEAVILELAEIEPLAAMRRLGGTIKIGEALVETKEQNLTEEILKILKNLTPAEGKLIFGLSLYGLTNPKLGAIIKKKLKEQSIKARWVISRNPVLSSADVALNKLIGKGIELLIIKKKDDIFIAKTLAVQEFEKYSRRDYGRPARDVRSGMLPPKVAKMMINLAQAPMDGIIIDPFCGSGTILQEALLLGHSDIYGSDVSQQAVRDCKANLNWLIEKLKLSSFNYLQRIKQLDAEKLTDYFEENYFDAIITEPYLGPPLRGRETEREIKEIINELSELYLKFFIQAKFILKNTGRIVIIFPVFILNNKKLFLPILEQIEKIGFKIKNSLPEDWGFEVSERNSIIYSRAGQRVQREILVWEN
ncbi:MAG: DNA methyltransferase [bacterium]